MNKRLFIMGQGNIGSFLGAAFSFSGFEVIHYVRRPETKPASIVLDFNDRRRIRPKIRRKSAYAYRTTTRIGEVAGSDWVILPLGHQSWIPALEELSPLLQPDQTVVFCGNMWDEFDQIDRLLSVPYLFAFPNFGGSLVNQHLKGWLTPHVTVGITRLAYEQQLNDFRKLLQSVGFTPHQEKNITGWLKTHFAINAGMLAQAAAWGGFQEIGQSPKGLRRMYQTIQEALGVVKAMGINPLSFKEGRQNLRPAWLLATIAWLMFLLPGIAESADAGFDAAEWKSYGKRVAATGRRLGVKTEELEGCWAEEG